MKTVLCALNAKYSHSSLALYNLKKYCAEFDVSVKEYTINQDLSWVYSDLTGARADVYGFSCYIWNITQTLDLADRVKKALPGAKIMLGGPEAGKNAAAMFAAGFVDYVILGEGEEATRGLLCALSQNQSPETVAGIAFRKNGTVIENPPAPPVCEIPFAYDEENIENFSGRLVYYESSRGCPFGCTYCLSCLDKSVRFSNLEKVKRELLFFIRHNVPIVKFVDRTFNADKRRTLEIMRFLLENKKNTLFHFEMSADLFDEEFLAFLKNVPKGLFQFEIGIQSTNPKTLEAICRRSNVKKALAAVSRIVALGTIHVHLDLIAGLPYENFESFHRSFNQVYAVRPHMLQLGFLKLLHGTPLRHDAKLHGYRATSTPPYEVLTNNYLSPGEICELKSIENAVEKYYNSGVFQNALAEVKPDDAFCFYQALAKHLPGGAPCAQAKLFDYFYSFAGFSYGLVMDFLLHNRGVKMPGWARGEPVSKAARDAFLQNGENRRKYFGNPEIPVKELVKKIRIEKCGGKVFMADYEKKTVIEVLEWTPF